MKRLTHICLILLLMHLPFMAKGQAGDKPELPDETELSAISDSIIGEGVRLYMFEKLAWQAADTAMTYCPIMDQVNGNGIVIAPPHLIYFFSRDDEVIFSYQFNFNNQEVSWDNSVRPMTDEERDARKEREQCINVAVEAYGDSIKAWGSVNVDVIWIGPDLIRVYFLQSTTKNDVIPIGNDYSVDLSPDMKPLAFRRYHHSFLELPVEVDGEKVADGVVHSHTSDNPYITPTDICNLMLYGRDMYGMNTFYVLSTAFKKNVIQIFLASELSLTVMEYDVFKSLMNEINNGD